MKNEKWWLGQKVKTNTVGTQEIHQTKGRNRRRKTAKKTGVFQLVKIFFGD